MIASKALKKSRRKSIASVRLEEARYAIMNATTLWESSAGELAAAAGRYRRARTASVMDYRGRVCFEGGFPSTENPNEAGEALEQALRAFRCQLDRVSVGLSDYSAELLRELADARHLDGALSKEAERFDAIDEIIEIWNDARRLSNFPQAAQPVALSHDVFDLTLAATAAILPTDDRLDALIARIAMLAALLRKFCNQMEIKLPY